MSKSSNESRNESRRAALLAAFGNPDKVQSSSATVRKNSKRASGKLSKASYGGALQCTAIFAWIAERATKWPFFRNQAREALPVLRQIADAGRKRFSAPPKGLLVPQGLAIADWFPVSEVVNPAQQCRLAYRDFVGGLPISSDGDMLYTMPAVRKGLRKALLASIDGARVIGAEETPLITINKIWNHAVSPYDGADVPPKHVATPDGVFPTATPDDVMTAVLTIAAEHHVGAPIGLDTEPELPEPETSETETKR